MILIVDCVISDYDFVDDDGDLKKKQAQILVHSDALEILCNTL